MGAASSVFSLLHHTALYSKMKNHSVNVLDKSIVHVFQEISRPLCILNNNKKNKKKHKIKYFLLLIHFFILLQVYINMQIIVDVE